MKASPHFKDLNKRKALNSKGTLATALYHSYSKSKKRIEGMANSPNRYEPKEKNSVGRTNQSKERSRESGQRVLVGDIRPRTGSKTPKSGHTWLVRDTRPAEGERALHSKSKLEKRDINITNLENSQSPKAFQNAFMYAERSFHSSKAAGNRYFKGFSRPSDSRQGAESRNKFPSREHRIKTQFEQQKSPPKQLHPTLEIEVESLKPQKQQREVTSGYNCAEDLTEEEYKNFGDRFPTNFVKAALLGRGGFSLVWLGIQRKTKKRLAIKQILTKNPHQTHLKEIWFGNYFFTSGGEPRQQFTDHIGVKNICRLLAYDIRPVDTWLFYELCEDSLGNSLYQLRGENSATEERSYVITYKPLLFRFRQDPNQLKHLLTEICKTLMLLNAHNIVHSDLKTENILLNFRRKEQRTALEPSYIKRVKIIDFGSSFLFTNLKQFSMATPEYMPPQILNYILFQNELEYDPELLKKIEQYRNPWVIDIWSVGCILLEIVCGVPLWMSIKTKIQDTGGSSAGLFAVKGRLFPKIIAKQIQAVKRLDHHLDQDNHSGIKLTQQMRCVLKRMLHLQPSSRISPREILTTFGVDCPADRVPFY